MAKLLPPTLKINKLSALTSKGLKDLRLFTLGLVTITYVIRVIYQRPKDCLKKASGFDQRTAWKLLLDSTKELLENCFWIRPKNCLKTASGFDQRTAWKLLLDSTKGLLENCFWIRPKDCLKTASGFDQRTAWKLLLDSTKELPEIPSRFDVGHGMQQSRIRINFCLKIASGFGTLDMEGNNQKICQKNCYLTEKIIQCSKGVFLNVLSISLCNLTVIRPTNLFFINLGASKWSLRSFTEKWCPINK